MFRLFIIRIRACRIAPALLFISLTVAGQSVQQQAMDAHQTPAAGATLQGVVRDSLGHPVAGALVSLQNANVPTLTVHTDSAGAFLFLELRQGTYNLRAETAGYDPIDLNPIVLAEKQSRTINLTLNVAKAAPDKNSSQPQFFDEPRFTVAGVTDTTSLGGHGSQTIVQNREALTQATASLSKPNSEGSPVDSLRGTAEQSLREAVTRQPQDFEANYRLGKFLVDESQSRQALPYLQQAFRLSPDAFDNTYELARAYMETGDYVHARSGAIALLAGAVTSNQKKADLHRLLAELDEKGGDALGAVREYQKAVELNPSEINLFNWGVELLMHHAPEPAIEVFTRGKQLFPRSERMLAGLGAAWYSLGSFDHATESFCEASDLDPDNPTPYLLMGKMLALETSQSAAIQTRLERFVKLQPENALANYYYAVSLWRQRESSEGFQHLDEVKSLLEKSVHLDPKLGLGYLQLGIIYAEQKDFPKAISALQQSVEVSPQLDQAHYRLAQLYRQSGDSGRAHTELQLYEKISAEKAEQSERQRHEMQQFVYEMK